MRHFQYYGEISRSVPQLETDIHADYTGVCKAGNLEL